MDRETLERNLKLQREIRLGLFEAELAREDAGFEDVGELFGEAESFDD